MMNGDCFGRGEFINPILAMGTQVSCLLVISHFFQVLMKPLGQPSPVALILAGFVLGPSCLSYITSVRNFFFNSSLNDYYETLILYARITIMFMIGLETDILYLKRNLHKAFIVACASCFVCTVLALSVSTYIFHETGSYGSGVIMALTLAIILCNTASPFVVRLVHDLRFASTDIGRLAISSSLMCDGYAVFLLIIILRRKNRNDVLSWIMFGVVHVVIVAVVIVGNRYVANWLNGRNRNLKYLKNTEISVVLAILFIAATALETMGYSSIIACYLIGAMFPRGGKTGRTLSAKLSYTVNNFILPLYFGYCGFKADVTLITSFRNVAIVAVVIVLSVVGKVTGTLAACFHLKIPLNEEGVLIAFLMNLKGHVDLLALSAGFDSKLASSQVFYNLMTAAVVIDSLIWGPVIAYIVRRENDLLAYKHVPFEYRSPENELKLLACVHDPRPVASMIGLIASCKGSENVALTPYLMHLIELPEKTKTNLLYHQKEEDELSDDDNYGGNDVVEINEAVDIFASQTGMIINQVKIVSPFASMHEDVCEFTEDIRASIIILPFHKYQRIDGKLERGKEGIRMTNQNILRHAKCSVAILVDRGLTAGKSGTSDSGSLQHIAVLFFGGPDDREALGLSKRLVMYHHIKLTIVRFLHSLQQPAEHTVDNKEYAMQKEEDILMEISNYEYENDADNAAITEFFKRYVTSGQAGYVEKQVENGGQIATFLREMVDSYSMYIVGKGGRGTTGISDWEECPELGKLGDFLASSEFDLCGSVLVIQQLRPSKIRDED